MSTAALDIARERQLDWLLDEVLGSGKARSGDRKAKAIATHWLAAAIALLAIATAVGVGLIDDDTDDRNSRIPVRQDPQPGPAIDWHECHGVAALEGVPADVRNLKCFDFTDQGLAALVQRLPKLERLDLSGMDVNAKGYSESLKITDAGVAHLSALTGLQWLSLRSCPAVEGTTLASLRAIPQLEHLDCSATAIRSPAIAALARWPSLRELALNNCMDFHGRSLEDIARIPGLRRLELSYCPTIRAADVVHLAKLHELRHLDLSLCMGAFQGQTAAFDDMGPAGAPAPPEQDGVGVTDAAVVALEKLPLHTLDLSGCHSLTDACGTSLARIKTLHTLGVGGLPKTSGSLLERIPADLRSLSLDNSHHLKPADLAALRRFPSLDELGLTALKHLDDDTLRRALAGKQLKVLRLGGEQNRMGPAEDVADRPDLTSACRETLTRQTALEELNLSYARWLDQDVMRALASLPKLRKLQLQATVVDKDALTELARSTSLRDLSLLSCRRIPLDSVMVLQPLQLTAFDAYATKLPMDGVRKLASGWRGCRVRMPDASIHRVP